MKKIIWTIVIVTIVLTVNALGQKNQSKKNSRKTKTAKTRQIVQYNTTDWDAIRRKRRPAKGLWGDDNGDIPFDHRQKKPRNKKILGTRKLRKKVRS